MVEMYGGNVVYFSGDYTEEINVKELEKFLEADHNFKYATVVYCDTPTGMLNDISKICPLLKSYGILTVVEGIEHAIQRHSKIAEAVRKALTEYGLELFNKSGYSNTVTVVNIPESIGALKEKNHMLQKYNVLIATSLEPYTDQVIRIGHMGENAKLALDVIMTNISIYIDGMTEYVVRMRVYNGPKLRYPVSTYFEQFIRSQISQWKKGEW